ncbi:hypothetical protein FD755_008575 [Muntiacus reevesi]|uniref:SOCS box domain-containing protein n=1 Tax=Muntiacus reevesi TaxID=9886 RepID=A0A5J5MNA8_MUNRE|nr:hypothetical protein FD755_008575 [Muntiacus reevesi]
MDFTEAYADTCSTVGLAAREGNVKVLRKLLKKGRSIDVADNRGWMPIHEAAYHNSVECMRLLIHADSSENYIKTKTFEGFCALHLAASQGHWKIIQILLEAGADPNATTLEETTPLFLGANVNCQALDKATPLFIAAQEGHTECVELLLSSGADPDLYCNEDNWQLPIHAAAQMGHTKILDLLIPLTDRVCDTEPNKVSPVYSAVFGGHEECLEMLLQSGYSPDAQMCLVFGFSSPLCMAFQKNCDFFGIVNILLKYGAQLNELHLAYCLKYERFSVFRYFLKKCCASTPWDHISEFINHAVKAQTKYKEWLPSLLLAGFDPLNLLCTSVPSLTHLCRLEIWSRLKLEHLQSDGFIRQLPLPRSLHDYLLYAEVLRMNEVPELAVIQDGEISETT